MPTSIETLINDERLHILFKSENTHCAMQLWLLQVKKENDIESHLLYGRVVPYNFSDDTWRMLDDKFKSFDNSEYKARVIRISLYCASNKLINLISSLCNDHDISSVNDKSSFEISESSRKQFGSFKLSEKLCYRPVSYLPNRDYFNNNGLKSPHGSAGAFSASIVPFDKKSIFIKDDKIEKDIFDYAIKLINDDTGMSFDKEDMERLGDLELLAFPTLDDHERNVLKTDWKEKGKIINVSLEQGSHYKYDIFHIKASFTNDGKIVYSTLKTVQALNGLVFYDFELPNYLSDMLDGLHIEIHAERSDDKSAILYCQYGCDFIREMNTSIHLMSSFSGTVKSDWMTKSAKLPVNHEKITKAQSINQGSETLNSIVGGRKADPWVSINRDNNKLLKKALPTPSDGRFFECYKEGNGLGRLEFVEWIKNILNKHQNHQVIIFDPYFEDVGITLVVPNASANGDYIVFTTTEHRTEQQRLNNLISCCEQLSLLVSRIRLRVFALDNGSFHDRYILISEKSGESIKGFHLSNSIQKANENYPLLITPIPLDVLIKVNDYAIKVLDKEKLSKPFFDSKAQHNKNATLQRYEPLPFLNEKEAGTVLAAWTGLQELNNLSADTLKIKLGQLGFLRGESLDGEKFSDCTNIFNFLSQTGDYNFNQYWSIVGHILANTPAGDFFDDSYQSFIETLSNSLLNYLNNRINLNCSNAFDIQEAFSYCQSLKHSLNKIIHYDRTSEYHHGIKFNAISWGEYYAIKILWHYNPSSLLSFIEEKKALVINDTFQQEKTKAYSILAQAISEIALSVQFGLNDNKIKSLIRINNDFLKWFGYCALKSAIIQDNSFLSIIDNIPAEEKIMLLGSMITSIARYDNQETLFEKLIEKYLSTFPVQFTTADITLCIDSLRGHMNNLGWCEPWLFNKIVVPLINSDRIDFDNLANIWINELENIFEGILSGQSAIFKIENEGRTTDIAAYLMSYSSFETQTSILKRWEKKLNDLSRNIKKPLANSSNWKQWNSSLSIAMWMYGVTKWIYYHLPLPLLNLIEPTLSKVFNEADKLKAYRTEDEWKKFDLDSQGLSVFLKNRSELSN
jgi:hypothetical protein